MAALKKHYPKHLKFGTAHLIKDKRTGNLINSPEEEARQVLFEVEKVKMRNLMEKLYDNSQ